MEVLKKKGCWYFICIGDRYGWVYSEDLIDFMIKYRHP